MKRLRIALVVLVFPFVSLHAETDAATPPTAFAASSANMAAGRTRPARGGLILMAEAGHAALLAQDTRFEPRLQLHSSVSAGVGADLGRLFTVSSGLAVEYAAASSAAGGYLYPAWTGRTLWIRTDLRLGSLMSARLEVSAVLASYESSFLLFFFPTVGVGPIVRLPLAKSTWLVVGAQFRYQIREDLSVAGSSVPGALLFGVSVGLERAIAPVGRP